MHESYIPTIPDCHTPETTPPDRFTSHPHIDMTMRRDDVLLPLLAVWVGAALSVGLGAVFADPVVDVVGSPDLALGEVGYGWGKSARLVIW